MTASAGGNTCCMVFYCRGGQGRTPLPDYFLSIVSFYIIRRRDKFSSNINLGIRTVQKVISENHHDEWTGLNSRYVFSKQARSCSQFLGRRGGGGGVHEQGETVN